MFDMKYWFPVNLPIWDIFEQVTIYLLFHTLCILFRSVRLGK